MTILNCSGNDHSDRFQQVEWQMSPIKCCDRFEMWHIVPHCKNKSKISVKTPDLFLTLIWKEYKVYI